MTDLEQTAALIEQPSAEHIRAAEARQASLTKPSGSLGFLEELGCALCGMYAECPPPAAEPVAIAVFAGDHGVHRQRVTPWPQQVTAEMVANLAAGGAVVNAMARQVGADVVVVDVGVATDLPPAPGLLVRKVAHGTADLASGPAMTRAQAREAIGVGIDVATSLARQGYRLLVSGDMGIANTTASAALVAVFAHRPAAEVTGRGTGIDDETLARKVAAVEAAVVGRGVSAADPLGALAEVGGLEHAALAGFLIAAAAARVPVVLDGVIACSAALVARALAPSAPAYWVAGHRSAEPGAGVALAALGLRPLVDLDLRLGEGSGAALAVPIVQAAARVLREVATFDAAGVSETPAPGGAVVAG
ncbi:MAG: nicotinate-nucleotide--dimethylbenzimidazole phosphoribosyltransferase [Dermatophilaceae bacterium]